MLLTVAACIGHSFDFKVLMKVYSRPHDEVVSILQWSCASISLTMSGRRPLRCSAFVTKS